MSSMVTSDDAPARTSRWSGIVPAARWLRSYKPAWFRADLIAGITLYKYATYEAMLKQKGLVAGRQRTVANTDCFVMNELSQPTASRLRRGYPHRCVLEPRL
jgi:hypothetical protein